VPAIYNTTPFAVDAEGLFDADARQHLILMLSATFEVRAGGDLAPAEKQNPVRETDEYYGEAGQSSLRFGADVALEKSKVDVLINGTAYAPRKAWAEAVQVGVEIGELRKRLIVSGDRFWEFGAPSSPRLFQTMPIRYERSFGGTTGGAGARADLRNTVGVGFKGARSADPEVATEVANVEYPDQRISSSRSLPEPAGFGPLCRYWTPRSGFAGTYGEKWLSEEYPLLPADFDVRFFECAPRDQQLPAIEGGELVTLTNLTPEGVWTFRLPRLTIPVRLLYADRTGSAELKVDTLLIEPDARTFTLTARAKLLFERNRGPLEEVVIGDVTKGWWRARVFDKPYLDRTGLNGASGRPSYLVI
jgi:hypothetical protein